MTPCRACAGTGIQEVHSVYDRECGVMPVFAESRRYPPLIQCTRCQGSKVEPQPASAELAGMARQERAGEGL